LFLDVRLEKASIFSHLFKPERKIIRFTAEERMVARENMRRQQQTIDRIQMKFRNVKLWIYKKNEL
jgi:hypothetical protein